MLLWLTLTVLWSTPCLADQIYGYARGPYFSSTRDNTNDISGIRVYISLIGIIKSVQLRYGSKWSGIYGVQGGWPEEFLLGPDEYIVGLGGSHGIYISRLVVYTNLGRLAAFGMGRGYSFTASPNEPGKILTGIFGRTQGLGITGIGFKWDYPLADQPPTAAPTPAPSTRPKELTQLHTNGFYGGLSSSHLPQQPQPEISESQKRADIPSPWGDPGQGPCDNQQMVTEDLAQS